MKKTPDPFFATVRRAVLAIAIVVSACYIGGRAQSLDPPPPDRTGVLKLQHDIDTLLANPALERGSWGILVKSLSGGETLYSRDARKLLMPASNMKIVTLAVAAQLLGWNYTYETRLAASGPIHDGVLDGDLIVIGSGDPSMDDWDGAASRVFRGWAGMLKAAGIRTISGRIVGDGRAFGDEPFGIGWAWDDLDNSYGTSIGGLQFNENTARLVIEPAATAGQAAAIRLLQAGSGLVVRNGVTTTEDRPLSITTQRLAGSPLLDVRGSVRMDRPAARPILVNVSVVDPALYFATALRDSLIASGIEVRGPAVDIVNLDDPPKVDGPPLLTYGSPPLTELAVTMMKNSQNLYAESMLRAVGGNPATLQAARSAVESVLQSWGIGSGDVVIADGSGLSRNDLVTSDALVAILTHERNDEASREPFERSLPIAGVDGTLAFRMKGTVADRNVHAKTGSFSNARSASGYVTDADGQPLVFSIISNNFGISPDVIERTEDAIMIRLAEFTRR
jgi:D-alanyl-D-alanine carboxypeptidase/D-alanyl-D-alanine-endopeptidase (penicillin-binding protein 4)